MHTIGTCPTSVHEFVVPSLIIKDNLNLNIPYARLVLSILLNDLLGRVCNRPSNYVIPRSSEESRSYWVTGTGFLLADSSK